jgi:ribulose-phosphate 3-epimerase
LLEIDPSSSLEIGIGRWIWTFSSRELSMNPNSIKIAPSILAADFARLGDQVREAERAGADRIHVDVMDGHFVPNLTMGPPVVQSLRSVTSLPLEVHLMVAEADLFLDAFAKTGADSLLVHQEPDPNLHRTVQHIKSLGKKAGVVINPATPAIVLDEILADVELVLVMTVNPGFGGQAFIANMQGKIRRVRQTIDQVNPVCELEVDGGIDAETAPLAVKAGASVLVAGSAIFHDPDGITAGLARIRNSFS